MSMPESIGSAVDGAALALIGPAEKRALAILSRKAWEKLGKPGLDFDAWRRQQVLMCCERQGLRQARHEDFNYIKAHMLRILGAERQAAGCDLRAATERRRQAIAKLQEECRKAIHVEHPDAYVKAIARSKFKTTQISRELSAHQVWQLIFSLRNAEARRKRT
jgi:glycine/D-amino acid oxidase-like deaminating enzyme